VIGPRHIQSKSKTFGDKKILELEMWLKIGANGDTLKLDPSALVASIFPSELVVVTTIGIELSSMTVTFGETAFITKEKK